MIAAVFAVGSLAAQNHWAIKTNAVHEATGGVNVAAEYAFAPKWSMELSGSVNMWDLPDGFRLKHAIVQPAVRYWLCDRFNGWFFGAHLTGGIAPEVGGLWDFSKYYSKFPNLKKFMMKDAFMMGAGVSTGYAFILGRHWNLELEFGLGYTYIRGDEYSDNVLLLKGSQFDYIGPTRLGITIGFLF